MMGLYSAIREGFLQRSLSFHKFLQGSILFSEILSGSHVRTCSQKFSEVLCEVLERSLKFGKVRKGSLMFSMVIKGYLRLSQVLQVSIKVLNGSAKFSTCL